MKKFLKLLLVCGLCLLGVSLLYIIGVVAFNAITEFKPEKRELIDFVAKNEASLIVKDSYSILSWNLGYAGLGKEMDFFYEEGKMVRPEKEWNFSYLDGITRFIANNDTINFFLFQEIDVNSHRSYNENQVARLQKALPRHTPVFALNYRSAYVPVPWYEPMGKVKGGLATFSRVAPEEAVRLATPGKYPWPTRLFMLKRCLIKTTFPLENGKSLVLYNVHNSAFDDASELRVQELEFIRNELLSEFEKGNYVVAGGDWNQNPPGLDITGIKKYVTKELWLIAPDYFPEGWQWVFDPNLPTNRDVDKPFDASKTTCTIIDFFLTSPNIQVIKVKTIDRQFYFSDHLPVILTFRLD